MLRTKYIVVFCILLTIGLLVVAGYLTLKDTAVALGGSNNTALLIHAETKSIGASVEKDSTREETRTALRASLLDFVSRAVPEVIPEIVNDETAQIKTDEPENMSETVSPTMSFCDTQNEVSVQLESWGPVNTVLAEANGSSSSQTSNDNLSRIESMVV